MISSNSVWDRKSAPKIRSSAFSLTPARLVYEFENRSTRKIFSHTLGDVTFSDGAEAALNASRDAVISGSIGQRNLGGYRYHSISHAHLEPTVLSSDNGVLGHGVRVKGGYENCAMIAAECVGDGTDTKCEAGKCRIGTLTETGKKGKWLYESDTVPGLFYYVFGTESVQLRTVVRGEFALPAGQGTVDVVRPASIPATVYLPPSTYSDETFTRRVIRYLLDDKTVSLQDTVDNFLRSFLTTNYATVRAEKELKDRVIAAITAVLDPIWANFITEAIEGIWRTRYEGDDLVNRDFLIEVYGEMSILYNRCVEVVRSSVRGSRVLTDSDSSRPVYDRLPGISGAYNSEDRPENPSKWLVSGVDAYLSYSKTFLLDRFYQLYLDPETCYPLCLDWIAQHVGFTSPFWSLDWDPGVKRLLIANAQANRITDLTNPLWVTDDDSATLPLIDPSRIETISTDTVTGAVTTVNRYVKKVYDEDTELTSLVPETDLAVNVSRWPGILPAKGSLISLIFLLWAFNIKAFSGEEMSYNTEEGTYSVRSGLRRFEFTAPVNTPFTTDVLHVGEGVGDYPNQLIADIGVCYDDDLANTVVVRMPFYYNRDGRSWDATVRIVDNFVPATAVSRVQYAIAAADLLAADDILFEPA